MPSPGISVAGMVWGMGYDLCLIEMKGMADAMLRALFFPAIAAIAAIAAVREPRCQRADLGRDPRRGQRARERALDQARERRRVRRHATEEQHLRAARDQQRREVLDVD